MKNNAKIDRVAIVDPSSYSLPYDYYFIREVAKNIKVDFYFSAHSANYQYIKNLSFIENVRLFEYSISPSISSRFSGVLSYISLLFSVFLRQRKYRYIHFIWSIFPIFELAFFLFIRKKLVFTFHNDAPHGHASHYFLPFSIINRLARKIVFVSEFTKRRFCATYGSHPDVHLVQHGIMPVCEAFENFPRYSSVLEKKLIFWGRVESYKGLDMFLKFDLDLPVEIYGRWSRKLHDLRRSLSAKPSFLIVDEYLSEDDLSRLLSREAVFILPYKDATQSGVLYTLLAHAKVFIASAAGENKEFLEAHGLGKLVFDRADFVSFKNAVQFAFQSYEEILEKMLLIREKYRWDVIMDPIVSELYG